MSYNVTLINSTSGSYDVTVGTASPITIASGASSGVKYDSGDLVYKTASGTYTIPGKRISDFLVKHVYIHVMVADDFDTKSNTYTIGTSARSIEKNTWTVVISFDKQKVADNTDGNGLVDGDYSAFMSSGGMSMWMILLLVVLVVVILGVVGFFIYKKKFMKT